jgi:hypothetical protein
MRQIDERITQLQSLVSPEVPVDKSDPDIVTDTTTGEVIRILSRPDPNLVSKQLDELKARGISSIAIAFVHSYLWGEHERMVAEIAEKKGFAVSVSSQLQPMVRTRPNALPRLSSIPDQTSGPGKLFYRRRLPHTCHPTLYRVIWRWLRRRSGGFRQQASLHAERRRPLLMGQLLRPTRNLVGTGWRCRGVLQDMLR